MVRSKRERKVERSTCMLIRKQKHKIELKRRRERRKKRSEGKAERRKK